jgi:magnesium transporter
VSSVSSSSPQAGNHPTPHVVLRKPRRWFERARRPFEAPGTVASSHEQAEQRIDVIAYSPDKLVEQQLNSLSEISNLLSQHSVVWVNVEGVSQADKIKEIGHLLGLHPLALEDVVNTHQRAKVDEYGDILFIVARMVQGPPIVSEQISLFCGPKFVVTFQEDLKGDCLDSVRHRIRQSQSRVRQLGSDYLMYELLDAVIDGYFPVIERYGELVDQLEDAVPDGPDESVLASIHAYRADLLQLRRAVWPFREAVLHLTRSEASLISRETRLYLRDAYDHTIQLMDILEIYRETCADLREFYYNIVTNRTNDIMRVLTVIATLFMPLSFVAGVYGMNFEDMPELKWPWGYFLCLLIMATIAVSFLSFFWRRGWIGQPNRNAFPRRR